MHDANVRVSYLMVTRNRGTYLSKALQNIREFITPEDELIIVDGGSTDDTKRIAAENADIISVFLSEPDRGEGHAVNKGLALIPGRNEPPDRGHGGKCRSPGHPMRRRELALRGRGAGVHQLPAAAPGLRLGRRHRHDV